MATTVTVMRVDLTLWGAASLKEKRSVLRPLLERSRRRFGVSAAEVEAQDDWGRAVLAFAAVSSSAQVGHATCQQVLRFIEGSADGAEVAGVETETLYL